MAGSQSAVPGAVSRRVDSATMSETTQTITFDPGLRGSIELLYGPEPAKPGEIRGKTVRGKAHYSRQAAIEAAIRDVLPRMSSELRALARHRPGCSYVHGPTTRTPTCPDETCQRWIDEIVEWHTARFGPKFAYVTYNEVGALSAGGKLSLGIHDDRSRDTLEPVTIALDLAVNGDWLTSTLGIHAMATKADLHDLVDRLWPEIERLRLTSAPGRAEQSRSNGREGRLDRPARATYWRLRQFQGLSLQEILAEWAAMTKEWTHGSSQVGRSRLEYPAWIEWKRRGASAGVEQFDEVGSIQRAIAKLRRFNA